MAGCGFHAVCLFSIPKQGSACKPCITSRRHTAPAKPVLPNGTAHVVGSSPQQNAEAGEAGPAAADPAGVKNDYIVYQKLPADIAERHVLLLDPILATGNSACRAIQARPDCSCQHSLYVK